MNRHRRTVGRVLLRGFLALGGSACTIGALALGAADGIWENRREWS